MRAELRGRYECVHVVHRRCRCRLLSLARLDHFEQPLPYGFPLHVQDHTYSFGEGVCVADASLPLRVHHLLHKFVREELAEAPAASEFVLLYQ